MYLLISIRKSIPTKIRQLILCISNYKGSVDGFALELTFAKQLYRHFLWDKLVPATKPRPESGPGSTRDPSWGHPRCGLGAVGAVLEPFCGHLSPNIDKVS